MTSRTRTMCGAVVVAAVLGFIAGPGAGTAQAVVMFDWAIVDQDLGNAGDAQPEGRFGSVAYAYRISKYETTNAQYAEFLNAKAALVAGGDTLGLYTRS